MSDFVNPTLITMFHDINRHTWSAFPRNTQAYIDSFDIFLQYDYDMIIYVDDKYVDTLQKRIDHYKSPNKRLVPINRQWLIDNLWSWSRLEQEKAVMASASYKELVKDRIAASYPENVNPEYTILTHSKIDVVNHAIDNYDVNEYVAWVDFGYFHNKTSTQFLPKGPFKADRFNLDRVNICLVNDIDERDSDLVYTLQQAPEKIGAYFFLANPTLMKQFQDYSHAWLVKFQEEYIICDDEQGLWLKIHFNHPDFFKLHVFNKWHDAMRYFTV